MSMRPRGVLVVSATEGKNGDVPIVLLTASVQEQHREEGLGAGADEFMRKPFSPRDLLEQVERLVARNGRPA